MPRLLRSSYQGVGAGAVSSFARGISKAALERAGVKVQAGRNGKYNAARTPYNGVIYDSKLEAAAAAMLDLMQVGGLVTRWERQPTFDLHAGISYRADFRVWYAVGGPRTIDMKGHPTADFKLKKRLYESLYGPLDVVKTVQDLPTVGLSDSDKGGK